jgi:outer membrane protein TolC
MNFGIKIIITGCMVVGLFTQSFSQKIGLEQVIREVCANSDSVKMMKETVKKSDQMVRENWSAVYPTISATGAVAKSYGSLFSSGSSSSSSSSSHEPSSQAALAKQQDLPPGYTLDSLNRIYVSKAGLGSMFGDISKPQTTTIYNTGLQISQTLYTFGKVGTALQVAKNFNQSTRLTYKRNMQAIQIGALDAFYRTVLAERAGTIAEHSLLRKKELNEFLDRNFKSGSGSRAQVLATKADVANQSTATLIAKRDARTARMYLNAFMNRPLIDSSALDTIGIPSSLTITQLPSEDEAVSTAFIERDDLKSLKFLEEATKGGAKIYRAMYLPSIGAQGSAGYSKMESGSSLVPPGWQKSWTIGVGAQWTLFDGFASSAKAAQYTSDANKLEITCNTISKMIEIDVRSAITECVVADSNFAASIEMFNAARESYDLTNNNFKQGSGQFADLQLSDELLQQSELGLINARYRQVRSRAALLIAMGREIISLN